MLTTRPRAGAVALLAALALSAGTIAPAQAQSSDPGPTFACDPGFYQVIAGQLAELDPGNETYRALGPNRANYNAVGYRIVDGYLYGIRGADLLRIDADGAETVVFQLDMPSGSYTGDFGDDGLLHISRGGVDWHTVDVETGEAVARPQLSGNYRVADVANVYGVFYGVSSQGELFRIDPAAATVENLGVVDGTDNGSGSFGAAWSSAGGNLYVGRNTGEIFQVTGYSTDTPVATQVASAPSTNSNDGASCSLAPAPAGIVDVDGPEPETEPSTPEAQQAAANYEQQGGTTYTFPSSGVPDGPSCATGVDEDRPARIGVDAASVSAPTVLYSSGDAPVLSDFDILSGLWTQGESTLHQTHDCGFDYTALLHSQPVNDYRWQATIAGADGVNQAGLIVNQSSPLTRSGATVVDLADGGDTLRWGFYGDAGYYQRIGSMPIDLGAAATVDLSIDVHGTAVEVSADGVVVVEFTAPHAGGHVGLVTSRAAASFDELVLTALPTPEAQ